MRPQLVKTWQEVKEGKPATHQHTGRMAEGGGHIIKNLQTGELEVWFANWCRRGTPTDLRYKNMSLEFAHGYNGTYHG